MIKIINEMISMLLQNSKTICDMCSVLHGGGVMVLAFEVA